MLVDLNGHSQGARPGIWVRRPAAVCINWLGYPSSSGGLVDLSLVDAITAPPELQQLYSEQLVYLPHTYFIADHAQLYPKPFGTAVRGDDSIKSDSNASTTPTRREYGPMPCR